MNFSEIPIKPEDLGEEIPFPITTGSVPQIFYDRRTHEPVTAHPHQVSFVRREENVPDNFIRLDSILDYLSRYEILIVRRTYALGDVLMVLPFVRFLKNQFPSKRVVLLTNPEFFPILCLADVELRPGNKGDAFFASHGEVFVDLDRNTFECDHNPEHPFSRIHRVDILYDLFRVPKTHREYNFSVSVPEHDRRVSGMWLESVGLAHNEFFYFSWRGSNPIKTFPLIPRIELIKKIAQIRPVVVCDYSRDIEVFSHPNVHWFLGNSASSVLGLMKSCRAVITTDSAALWFAHLTARPTVCFLGPTEESTRLAHHPLYPAQCRKLELKKFVGCPKTCHHTLGWCSSKVACFSDSPVDSIYTDLCGILKECGVY